MATKKGYYIERTSSANVPQGNAVKFYQCSEASNTSDGYITSRPGGASGIVEKEGKHAYDTTYTALPNCVGWAIGRFNEIYCSINGLTPQIYYSFGYNNASSFYDAAPGLGLKRSKTPKVGAIACSAETAAPFGHVAVVEKVYEGGNTILVSESKWSWGKGVATPIDDFQVCPHPTTDFEQGFIWQPTDGIPIDEVVEILNQVVKKIPNLPSEVNLDTIPDLKTELNKPQYKTEVNKILKSYNINLNDVNATVDDLMNGDEINDRVRSYFNTASESVSASGYRYTNNPPEEIDYPSVYYGYGSGPLITFEDEDSGKNEFAKFYPNIQLKFGDPDSTDLVERQKIILEQIKSKKDQWTEDTVRRLNLPRLSNMVKELIKKVQENKDIQLKDDDNLKGISGTYQLTSDTIVGFTPTDLTYTGELVANVGDTITSVLDKIVEFLNNDYEYFYNTDGQFVFRKKLTSIHLDYENSTTNQNNGKPVNDEKLVLVKNNTNYTPEVFPLEDSRLVISVNNNPDFANVKNDFSVWGSRDVNDTEIPIHYRCAIDKKPVYYKTLPRLVPRYFTLDTEKEIIETLVRRFSEIISEKESSFESHLDKCLSAFTYQSQKVENAYLSLWGTYNNNGVFESDKRFTDLISKINGKYFINIDARNVDSHLVEKQKQDWSDSNGLNYFKFLFSYLYYDSIGKSKFFEDLVGSTQSEYIYKNAFYVPRDVQNGEPLIFGVPLFRWEGDEPDFDTENNQYIMKYIDCPSLEFLPTEMRYSPEQKQTFEQMEQARIDELRLRIAAKYGKLTVDDLKADYDLIHDSTNPPSGAALVALQNTYGCNSLNELKELDLWPLPKTIDNLRLSMLAKRLVLKPRPSQGASATEEEVLEDAKKYNFFVYGKKSKFGSNNESSLINGIMDYIQDQSDDSSLGKRRTRLLDNLGVVYDDEAYSSESAVGGPGTYKLKGNGIIDKLNSLKISKNSNKVLNDPHFMLPNEYMVLRYGNGGIIPPISGIENMVKAKQLLKKFISLKNKVDLSNITIDTFEYLNLIWMPVLPMLSDGVIDIFNEYFAIPVNAGRQEREDGAPVIAELTGSSIQIQDTNYENLYKELQILFSTYREEISEAFGKIKHLAQEIRDYVISQLTAVLRDEVYKDIKAIKTAYAKEQYIHGDENTEDHKTSIVYVTDEKYLDENETCPHYVVDWREIIWQMAEDYNKSNIDQIPNWLGDADFLWRVAKNNQDYYPTGRTGYEQYYIDVHDNFRDLYQEGYHWSYADNKLTDGLVYYWKREGSEDVKFNPVTDDETTRRLIDIPETLNFYFDFIDSENSAVSQFSVPAIGRRPKFVNDEKVKVINNEDVPQILFVPKHQITEDFAVGDARSWSYKTQNSEDEAFIDEDSAGDVISESLLKPINLDQIKIDYPDFRVVQVDDAWFVSTDIVETGEDNEQINGGFYPTGLNRSAKQVIESWLSQYTYCGENLNLTTLPIYSLKPNSEIYIKDTDTETNGLYLVSRITIPLAYNGTMNIECTKQVRNIK